MASRNRESYPSRSVYSSADAYRALPSAPSPSTAHAHAQSSSPTSSDEDALLPAPPSPPMHAALATAFVRTRARSRRDSGAPAAAPSVPAQRDIDEEPAPPRPLSKDVSHPLSPPRPPFVADGDRRSSGTSSADTLDLEPASDSDASASAGPAARGTQPPPVAAPVASPPGAGPVPRAVRARNHHRRRSSMANEYSYAAPAPASEESASSPSSSQPHGAPADTPPGSVYSPPGAHRAPPSAYPFPFQSHPGNPDPGTPIPGRRSLESLRRSASFGSAAISPPFAVGTSYPQGYAQLPPIGASTSDLGELGRPYAPFMEGNARSATPPSPIASQSQLYRASAAAAAAGAGSAGLYSDPNARAMRPNFLSPASRPGSSLWSPPSYPSIPYAYPPSGSYTALPGARTGTHTPTGGSTYGGYGSGSGSASGYPELHAALRKAKKPMRSHALAAKLTAEEKPWLKERDRAGRAAWWMTFCMMWLGVAGAAVFIYFGYTDVMLLPDSELCPVWSDEFDSLDLTNTWTADVELGGFGNGEFQMTTTDSKNLYVNNGELYIMPTLTSDEIGEGSVLDGYTYPLQGCTTDNATACSATSSNSSGTVVNPVQSARISTINSHSIRYGRVEVSAKLPAGDWLWPAIWMMPVQSVYGPWPLSGEIDIMEARGNGLAYTAQGSNYVRSTLNYGPLPGLLTTIFGWWTQKRASFGAAFHVYTLEWTPDFMRFSVDTRLRAMIALNTGGRGGKSFWARGAYPATAHNGSDTLVAVPDPWGSSGGASAPFDQNFYVILDLAVGGTSGWFPDNVGGKPWYDGSAEAMREFALAQGEWAATWPASADDRAFRVDYVRMWQWKPEGC
ncbi:glycoside hydrolase family 16 protein [Sparassis crispa]|uniref:Glycoside hydrolase family 16 protein n=1 Tax=Sparassis crispa TaxID=139825 RepID=A0A401GQ25_9APHY|nr:glycoside hydrolase family 16 protein [Sparassis crispa]GBE84302.1 glycoside hydrolase family 16 protein [Sparassis crispa]